MRECHHRNCNNQVEPTKYAPNKMYCTKYCMHREARLVKQSKSLKKLKDKYRDKKADVVNPDSDCKYCKDSSHEVFCCDIHKDQYNDIMSLIDIELNR